MVKLWIDFETRSRCDLRSRGVYNYAQDASTDVLCMSYAFGDDDVQTWLPSQPFPTTVRDHKGLVYAHNAAFERLIFWYVLQIDFKLEQFYCTAAQARANCAPGSLEDVGRFAGATMKKDHRGSQLIRLLSIPQADDSFRQDADLMQEMVDYCEQDVRAMRAVAGAQRPLSDEELADYHVNERINDRGILLDRPLAQAAVRYAEAEMAEIQTIVAEVTQGEITSVRSPKMRKWVLDRVGPQALELATIIKDGETKLSIDKSVRANLLALAEENPDEVPSEVAEVIQCADDLWASSVAKFNRAAALADAEDFRVRGAFVFAGGSATGRACVSAATLVATERGEKAISALEIGEKVLTHTGKFCKVSRIIYKGPETMYRLRTLSGGWVDCTAEHRLLNSEGWQNVKELISHKQSRSAERSDTPVYVAALPYNGRSGAHNKTDARDGVGNRAGDRFAGSATHPESGELFQIQDGRTQPYVWRAKTSRSHIEKRLSLSVARRQHLRARTPDCGDARVGIDEMAGRLGDTPHRQRQDKQLVGQLGDCDDVWASAVTLAKVTEIVCLGTQGVWDISVEGDASYVAQGLIHHNSSFGLQVHNFPRKCAADPALVRQAMVRGHQIVPLHGRRVTDVLKGMLRPALMADKGKRLVVADWAAIEARVTPWASDCRAGEAKLDIFAKGEDVYKHNAAATFRVPYAAVDKDQRQIGKVQELACGFAGGVGAFASMGRIYGLAMAESDAKRMVDAWRRANGWAVPYWSALEEAYLRAMRNKNREFTAGRVTYLFDGLHLWYALPSGRVLCYPFARFDDEGNLTYAKAAWKPAADAKEWPRARLWRGLACENVTQAVAHDLLRYALRGLKDVVLHVHDEIVLEVPTRDAEAAAVHLVKTMCEPPLWAKGLPLNAEVATMERYGK